mgnify:CR=1 FL=1
MEVGKIISNSLKYPFRNIKKLPILFVLFILAAIIPLGILFDNRYVTIFGVISFFLFILIFEEFCEFVHKCVDISELSVHRRVSYVCYVVDFL